MRNNPTLDSRMQQPAFYPEAPHRVERVETHISLVYLLEETVYKVKRPKNYGFLDFTTLEKRHRACLDEVRLNRRYAPDTYLDVVPIRRDATGWHLGGGGTVVEYAVHMRRLPEERMLCHLLQQGQPLTEEMAALGRRLATLHRDAPVCRRDRGRSDRDHLRQNWEENLTQTEPAVGDSLSPALDRALRRYVATTLEDRDGTLLQREEAGWVREVHGDLHTEHICLTEPIRIFDCIEFNRRFRVCDVLCDLAFLLMDLKRHSRWDLADTLWNAYRAAWQPQDPSCASLLQHYQVYRAYVRGKIDAFLSCDSELTAAAQEAARNRACRYFSLAGGLLLPPRVLLLSGPMGCGKSTLARGLAAASGWPLLSSDSLRDQVVPPTGRQDAFGHGRYTDAARDRVYQALRDAATPAVAAGQGVVVDASFATTRWRDLFRPLAAAHGQDCLVLELHCPRTLLLQRLQRRQLEGSDPSEGRPALLEKQLAAWEPRRQDEPGLVIDTSASIPYTVNTTLGQLLEIVGANHGRATVHPID